MSTNNIGDTPLYVLNDDTPAIEDLTAEEAVEDIDPDADYTDVSRLTKEVKAMAADMGRGQARSLVNAYYKMQRQRIRTKAQLRGPMSENAEALTAFFAERTSNVEGLYKQALQVYAVSSPVGKWSLSIKGIGPVIAAGLIAYVDIEKTPNAGALWRFSGLDPTLPRLTKGEKAKYNARLKTLCWKIGESFVKVSNRPDAVYGHMYATRKEQEIARNESLQFQVQALAAAERVGKTTVAYKWYSEGKLPPAHIHARARRYAVKLFLSHWHYVAFETFYGTPPEKPYILTQPEHSQHFITPPNWPTA